MTRLYELCTHCNIGSFEINMKMNATCRNKENIKVLSFCHKTILILFKLKKKL